VVRERGPTRGQIWRRRVVALATLAAVVAAAVLVVSAATSGSGGTAHAHGSTAEGKPEPDGYRLVHTEVKSKAVPGRELGYEGTFNEAVLRGFRRLHGRGPLVVFPAGGVHGYWHDRADGKWEDWVMKEVLPRVVRRYGVDPGKIAIGGISMGGFGAYDIALHNPGRFCAVGGHSPALWFEGAETAPGAFDDLADFERNDVVRTVQEEPDAFGRTKVWIDYGEEDPFRPYDEGFIAALEEGDADLSAHSWPGGHEGSYWGAHWPHYQRWYLKQLARCR
jgi:predicted esterase